MKLELKPIKNWRTCYKFLSIQVMAIVLAYETARPLLEAYGIVAPEVLTQIGIVIAILARLVYQPAIHQKNTD